jgi:hypothetical protein
MPFPYVGASIRPEYNHTLGQPLPPKSGFLSLRRSKSRSPCSNTSDESVGFGRVRVE